VTSHPRDEDKLHSIAPRGHNPDLPRHLPRPLSANSDLVGLVGVAVGVVICSDLREHSLGEQQLNSKKAEGDVPAKQPEQETPDVTNFLSQKIGSWFGPKIAYIFGITLLFVPIAWSIREPVYSFAARAWEAWKMNHPSVPEIAPGRFVIGIYVHEDNKINDQLLKELQIRYWRHPLIEVFNISLPREDDLLDRFDRWQREEVLIKDWIRKTGAVGAIWGDIRGNGPDAVALLNWTRAEFNDFTKWDAHEWLYEPSIAFAPVTRKQVGDFIGVWLKAQASLFHGARRLSNVEGRSLYFDKAEKSTFKDIGRQACEHRQDAKCALFGRVQLALFLIDTNNERELWCSDRDECLLDHLADFFYNWSGFRPHEDFFAPPIDSALTFQSIFLGMDYVFRLAGLSTISNQRSNEILYRGYLFLSSQSLRPEMIDYSVRDKYPHYREMLAAEKAVFNFLARQFLITNPPRSSDYVQSSILPPVTFQDMNNELIALRTATEKAINNGRLNRYESGVWHSRLGFLYGMLGGQDDLPTPLATELLQNAADQFRQAAELLDPYRVRTPRLVAAVYLNLSDLSLRLRDYDSTALVHAVAAAQKAETISLKYNIPQFYLNAHQDLAVARGWIAVRDRNLKQACEAINDWYVGASIIGADPLGRAEVLLRREWSRTDLDRLLLAFRRTDNQTLEECLTELDLDVPRIQRDLDALQRKN
jgi:hypothetical protein